MYNISNTQYRSGTKNKVKYKQPTDLRSSLVGVGTEINNISRFDNSHLTHDNIFFSRSSVRSIINNPMAKNENSGPLRLQYRVEPGIRSNSSVLSEENYQLDNYAHLHQRADKNQNLDNFSVSTTIKLYFRALFNVTVSSKLLYIFYTE